MQHHRNSARLILFSALLAFSASCATSPNRAPAEADAAAGVVETPIVHQVLVAPPFSNDVVHPTTGVAKGRVFHDQNSDGVSQPTERGIARVRVSNGRDIVTTDATGHYEIPVTEDTIVFIVKPRDWHPPVDDSRIPRFYYVHKPNGSPPGLAYPGVAPTGPLPEAIDFPLYRNDEPETFDVVVLGDPQPQSQRQIDYFAHDVLEELVGVNAAFGVSLGDLVFDDLSLFEPLNDAVASVGIPWYNVLGNHDMNYLAQSDRESDERFEAVYGPGTYAFEFGPVHFVVLDDVVFQGLAAGENGGLTPRYTGGVTDDQIAFLEAYLPTLPEDELLVLMTHIPFTLSSYKPGENRRRLFEVLALHPRSVSLAAHSHLQRHAFIGQEQGNAGPEHHQMVVATACGSWWGGAPDEVGLPHTTMRDGTPNGYWIFHFEGSEYSGRFKAARRPVDYQMNIWAPEVVEVNTSEPVEVLANVFSGSERSTVEMRVGSGDSWKALEPTLRTDPGYAALFEREIASRSQFWAPSPAPANAAHLFSRMLDTDLPIGTHVLEVRTTDSFGQRARARRFIRVVGPMREPSIRE
jgi:hypothetical protein